MSYHFPGPFEPMDNQRRRVQFWLNNSHGFDLSEMRTGKTASAAWAAHALMQEVPEGSILILCPLNTLWRVWVRTLNMLFGDTVTVIPLRGSGQERAKLLQENHGCFFVANHEVMIMPAVVRALRYHSSVHTVIVDEATAFKNARSLRSKAMRKLIPDMNVWSLTASPNPNSYANAYGVAKATLPNYTESFRSFRDRIYMPWGPWDWKPRKQANALVADLLQPSIRIRQDECFAVPDLEYELIEAPLSRDQKGALLQLKTEMQAIVRGEHTVTAVNAASMRTKFLQVAGGTVYSSSGAVHVDAPGRRATLIELIEGLDGGMKAIIFCPYRAQLAALEGYLSEYETATIHGDVPHGERDNIVRAFQGDGGPQLLLAEPRCLAMGDELDRANVIIWWLPIDNAEIFVQANGRIGGRHQKRKCVIYQLYSTKLEKDIYANLKDKIKIEADLLAMLKAMADDKI